MAFGAIVSDCSNHRFVFGVSRSIYLHAFSKGSRLLSRSFRIYIKALVEGALQRVVCDSSGGLTKYRCRCTPRTKFMDTLAALLLPEAGYHPMRGNRSPPSKSTLIYNRFASSPAPPPTCVLFACFKLLMFDIWLHCSPKALILFMHTSETDTAQRTGIRNLSGHTLVDVRVPA